MGGWGALELLAGECRPAAGLQATLSMCQGYSAEPLPAAQCGGDAGRGGLIRGAALWEVRPGWMGAGVCALCFCSVLRACATVPKLQATVPKLETA